MLCIVCDTIVDVGVAGYKGGIKALVNQVDENICTPRRSSLPLALLLDVISLWIAALRVRPRLVDT